MKKTSLTVHIILALILAVSAYQSASIAEYKPSMNLMRNMQDVECTDYPENYQDYCIYEKTKHANDIKQRLDECQSIDRENIRAYCIIDSAEYAIDEGKTDEIGDICTRIKSDNMESECFFRAAEKIARDGGDYELGYSLCKKSTKYEYDCIGHLEGIIYERDSGMALEFCQKIERDYEDIAERPIRICYHHFGLRTGRENKDLCDMIRTCEKAGKYKNECERGILAVKGQKEHNC
jgi:hypothetical protein